MRIAHILHEFPYPPTSGIRCDMARRLEAFRALGARVFAVAWASEAAGEVPSADAVAALDARLDGFALLPIRADMRSRLRRLWNLCKHPSYIAARIPPRTEREALIARIAAFEPDLIWLEGVHPAWLALELQRRLGVPLAYRAHNVEYRYLAEQARIAPTQSLKLALTAGSFGLERAERHVHAAAARVFDISADDLDYWRGEGYANGEWLAPQPDPGVIATMQAPASARDIDLLFVGSLSSPNNITGLAWYFDAVHPRVIAAVPDLAMTVAGRRPPAALAAAATKAGVTLLPDPTAVAPLFARARVMVNPIFHGSGVNIKTVDMLATGQRVVTTTKGTRGLPAEVVAELSIADTPETFAAAIVTAVKAARAGGAPADRTALIERVFGVPAVAKALSFFDPALDPA